MQDFEQDFFSKNHNRATGFFVELEYDANKEEVYCFVEGREDKIFYSHLYTKNSVFIQCNGVDQVEEYYKYITQNHIRYDLKRFAFFRDRDYSNEKTHGRKYVTPCYSLENLCLNKKTLENFLDKSLNISKNDIQSLITKYLQAEKDYLKSISHINAFLWCRFENKIQTEKQKKISINDVLGNIFDEKNICFDDHLKLQQNTKKHFEAKDLNFLKEKFNYQPESMENYTNKQKVLDINYYRGKFVLPFFIKFLKRMSEILSSNNNQITKKNYKIKKKILSNDLEQFFIYVKTPLCLSNFIQK